MKAQELVLELLLRSALSFMASQSVIKRLAGHDAPGAPVAGCPGLTEACTCDSGPGAGRQPFTQPSLCRGGPGWPRQGQSVGDMVTALCVFRGTEAVQPPLQKRASASSDL